MTLLRPLLLLILIPGLSLLRAQSVTQGQIQAQDDIRRQQQVQGIENSAPTSETVPEVYPGESQETGVQFILRAQPRKEWVEASVDSQYYYTSNAFFTEAPRSQTGVLVDTASVALTPPSFNLWGGKVDPRIGYSYQWFNYGLDNTANQLNNFDFDSATVFSNLRWSYQDYAAGFGVDWNRLLSHEGPSPDYTQIYAELTPHWSFERKFTVDDLSNFIVRYDGYIRITDVPDQQGLVYRRSNNRDDHSVTASYNRHLIDHLDLQAYYQILLSDYTTQPEPDREDFLNPWGLTLNYSFNEWSAIRFSASYAKRLTNSQIYTDYEVFNAGGGVNLVFRF